MPPADDHLTPPAGPAPATASAKTVQAPPTAPAPAAGRVPLQPLPPPKAPAAPERAARRARVLDGLLVGAVLLLAFLTALFPVYNSDFFLHAATGRALFQGRYHFGQDPFAFTTEGVYWVNNAWLFDVIVFALFSIPVIGGTVLIVLKALMVAALAELMLRTARRPGQSLWVPGVCVGLAVLAISARALLQPMTVSFFFLGLTYWLLRRPRLRRALRPAAPTGRRAATPPPYYRLSYWLIPPLCLLWANLDEWFLFGPLTVGLYLLGETLQQWLAPDADRVDGWAPGEQRTLGLVLLVSVAACLVNPHGVWAFAPPTQLGLSGSAEQVRPDAQFKSMFISPIDEWYFSPYIGLNAAGLAYFPLVLLGLVSFGLAVWAGALRWSRALLWAAFLVLSAVHARAVPFFAVVAGPIAALNFLDVLAARRRAPSASALRWAAFGRVLTLAAAVLLLVAVWPGWLEPRQAPPQELRRVGWTVEPEPTLKEAAETIQGWRDAGLLPEDDRWFNTAPEVLHYMAWYCPGERCFFDHRLPLYDERPDKRPGKGPEDKDFPAKDYLAVRRALVFRGDEGESEKTWRPIFHERRLRLLVFYDTDPKRPTSLLPRLFQSGNEWRPLFWKGHTVVFAWRDPGAPAAADPYVPLELDGDRLAFGPDAVPAPAARPRDPEPRAWWAALWAPPPPKPAEADEAYTHILRFGTQAPAQRERNRVLWDERWRRRREELRKSAPAAAASAVGMACSPWATGCNLQFRQLLVLDVLPETLTPIWEPSKKEGTALLAEQMSYQMLRPEDRTFDKGPPADLYLALRAARRALAADPDDANAWLQLGRAYFHLQHDTREAALAQGVPQLMEMRRIQAVVALHRAVTLNPDLELAHRLLTQLYQELDFADLALTHGRKVVELSTKGGSYPLETPEQTQERMKAMQKELEGIEAEVKRFEDQYELRAAGRSALERFALARENHLGQKALDVLLSADQKDLLDPQGRAVGAAPQLVLLLQTGQAEEAEKRLNDIADDEQGRRKALGALPGAGMSAYDYIMTLIAAADGDYAEAQQRLEGVQAEQAAAGGPAALVRELNVAGPDAKLPEDLSRSAGTALTVGHILLQTAPEAAGMPWQLRWPLKVGPDSHLPALQQSPVERLAVPAQREVLLVLAANEAAAEVGHYANLYALRGWLALEAGDVKAAGECFDRALAVNPPSDPPLFGARNLVLMGKEWLDAAAKKP
jgi:tetratricopeptide (TPR) repeat protein